MKYKSGDRVKAIGFGNGHEAYMSSERRFEKTGTIMTFGDLFCDIRLDADRLVVQWDIGGYDYLDSYTWERIGNSSDVSDIDDSDLGRTELVIKLVEATEAAFKLAKKNRALNEENEQLLEDNNQLRRGLNNTIEEIVLVLETYRLDEVLN